MASLSREDQKMVAARAAEFKKFRRDFLFSQQNLSEALGCSRRTIMSIESGQVVNPHADLLRRFRNLRRAEERAALMAGEAA